MATTMQRANIDLRPFGFTATESRVYAVLLELGPATGYAVARSAGLARANAYAALEGLVTRAAAARAEGRPTRYRPAAPEALLAQLGAEQGEALEQLARALRDAAGALEPDTRAVTGLRPLANLILQLVGRSETEIRGSISGELLRASLPAWRRASGRVGLAVLVLGPETAEQRALGLPTSAGGRTLLVIDRKHLVAVGSDPLSGVWTRHPALVEVGLKALGARE